jgi:hypothetical protein
MFRAKRVIAVAVALAVASTGLLASAAQAQASPQPAVLPAATCVVHRPNAEVYWFGYDNITPFTTVAAVGANNSLTTSGGAGPDLAQPDQFRPGTRSMSVAVRVAPGETATWTVASVDQLGQAPIAVTAIADASTPVCPVGAPLHSANVRTSGATIGVVPARQRRDAAGLLVEASVRFVVNGATTVCSAGGVPTPPLPLWGFADEFGVSPVIGAQKYAPIPTRQVLRSDTFVTVGRVGPGSITFQRTYSPFRTVPDPQRALIQIIPGAGTQIPTLGLTEVIATADMTGACWWGLVPVFSQEVFIGGEESRYSLSATDPITQTSRQAITCVAPTLPPACDYVVQVVGPGGSRGLR